MKIYKSATGGKPKVTLSLSEATLCAKEDGDDDIPKEHDLIAAPVTSQTMVAFDVDQGKYLGKHLILVFFVYVHHIVLFSTIFLLPSNERRGN